KKTRKPLGFANVIIVGTNKGAMSLDDGKFTVQGVPAGTYTVKAMMMGYKTIERTRVVINANQTTDLEFALTETIVAETQVIEVTGERKMIDVTSSDVRSSVTDEQILEMPVDNAIDAIALKTGIVKTGDELHARGGRSGEIQMQIDGVPVDDPLGGAAMDVGLLGVSGSDFIAGGMDAEYGNAQSGVININTKEGGNVFGGEFRYMTDDFGRQDKTYTNFDRVSLGFGGPTPWKSLRYYVSAEGTYLDGENVSIEPRTEHKLTSWLKARDRMNHSLNLQTKLSWNQAPFKVTGEAIVQRSRREQFANNWNIQGSVQKMYYFQRLIPTGTGQDVFSFGGISVQFEGPWLAQVADPNQQPNPRIVKVEQLVRDPSGNATLKEFFNFRAVDVGSQTILWDENLVNASGQPTGQRKSWVLFEGFQFPFSEFRATPAGDASDSSFVFFNSASRTPEIENENLQLKLSFNHNIADDILYSVNVSRLEFNRTQSVDGKAPSQFSSAGLPTELPSGTTLQGGVSQATWYTDPDFPYFVSAYDSPFFEDRNTVQYLVKTDLTSERVKGHRMKTGFQLIYNDLDQETRVFPAQTRENPTEGTVQQGRNVNLFHNFNPEGAVYAQDKWEYEGMVVNAGVRWEFFDTGNNNQNLIHNEEIPSEVETFKSNWSPRLGVAFPITDRDKFFFHYGRFTQWPSRTFLFATQDAIGSIGTLGNPDLGPELTVSYQAGISHQFSEDVAGNFVVFSKDIYGLISSTLVTDDSTGIQSTRFVNKTYASSRGLELSLEKRLTRRFGFEAYYTYSFADGVSSDSDFGRSAQGLTHLPTDERPLDWDQRHTFNVTLRLQERNNWGATAIYQFGSGLPWTPVDQFARLQDPLDENANRFASTNRLSVQGRKKFNIYGRELTLFFEGRNLLDEDIPLPGGDAPGVFPQMAVAQMDGGAYLTETGRFGGAYLADIDDDGLDDFVPVNDPTVFEQHRIWRVGFGFEF
ncbi:MAG: TonB-dependent receptor domain-containing protein, partial [Candidatus Krumholzibacteriia bacterium]